METAIAKKTLNFTEVKNQISSWLKDYATNAKQTGYIIGVSGGIDSAVCSTLCALTGLPLTVVRMSIHQAVDQADRGAKHIEWLKTNFSNVKSLDIDLTSSYDDTMKNLANANAFEGLGSDCTFLAGANTRSRLRMITLYAIGNANKLLVCGTGNKVEDYGVGFFTKFGDGGVDVSPIGELNKTEVYALGKELGIIQEILNARPTDGLWDDGRTDEDQIGATYAELEWAMDFCDKHTAEEIQAMSFPEMLSVRQAEVVKIYWARHTANAHKMAMPPICSLSNLR
jgi:NAD+ synthase